MSLLTVLTTSLIGIFMRSSRLPFRHEEAVEHADPLTQHGDLQLVFVVEVVHEVLHRHLASVRLDRVHLEPVPERPFRLVILVLWRHDGLGEGKEGQGQVGEPVLEGLHVGVALHQLVELQGDQAGHQRGGGGNGRNDPPRDTLRLESVCRGYGVVSSSKVTRGYDEINVSVGVVVLFKLDGGDTDLLLLELFGGGQLCFRCYRRLRSPRS